MQHFIQIKDGNTTAAANMARDWLLVTEPLYPEAPHLRTYSWSEPAITFGYTQRWAWICENRPSGDLTAIRRPTGGGIVDHRNDLTYALTIPSSHPAHRQRVTDFYRDLHLAVNRALTHLGIQARLNPCPESCNEEGSEEIPPIAQGKAGVCFQKAETWDVINMDGTRKIAGAALKRNRQALLVQGSLARESLPGVSLDKFSDILATVVADWLQADEIKRRAFTPSSATAETTRFQSEDWNCKR